MKKILNLILIQLVAFSFFSCLNLSNSVFEPQTVKTDNVYIITGQILIGEGAYPKQFIDIAKNVKDGDKIHRSATVKTDFSEEGPYSYFAKAHKKGNSPDDFTNGTIIGNSFSIALSDGEWTVTVGIKDSGGAVVVSDEYTQEISSSNPVLTHSFLLRPLQTEDGKGSLDLSIGITPSIKSVGLRVLEGDSSAWSNVAFALNDDKSAALLKTADPIKSGAYLVEFQFYDGDDQSGVIIFSTRQAINIFNGFITDLWMDDGSIAFINDGAMSISQTEIASFGMKNFYVSATEGSDSYSGTGYKPVRTLAAALRKVKSYNDSSTTYTIHLCSDITETGLELETTKNLNLQIVGENSNGDLATKTITGSSDSIKPILKLNGNGSSTTSIIIKNVNFTGNSSSVSNAGLVINNAKLILSDGEISENHSTYDSPTGSGGAFYVSSTAVLELNNVSINSNSVRTNGGGIYSEGTVVLTNVIMSGDEAEGDGGGIYNAGDLTLNDTNVQNCVVLGNGGGIYTKNRFEFNSGVIGDFDSEKSATSSDASNIAANFGGGIFVDDGTYIDTDSSCISYNRASNGGGICFSENVSTATTLNGLVKHNLGTTSGGGIYKKGSFTLTLDTTSNVSGNHAGSSGGGVYVSEGGLTIKGMIGSSDIKGSINPVSGDYATSSYYSNYSQYGGGIYFVSNSPDNKCDSVYAVIEYNYASEVGGGIDLDPDGKFTLNQGRISNNGSANQGGGIYFSGWDNNLIINGGEISSNFATTLGGGVCNPTEINGGTIRNNSVNASGKAAGVWAGMNVIVGGSSVSLGDDNFILLDQYSSINPAADLECDILFKKESPSDSKTVLGGTNISSKYKYFNYAGNAYYVRSDGKMYTSETFSAFKSRVSSSSTVDANAKLYNGDSISISAGTKTISGLSGSGTTIAVTSNKQIISVSGGTITFENFNFKGNGDNRNTNGNFINISGSSTVVIFKNCTFTNLINQGNAGDGGSTGPILVASGATLKMENCTIDGGYMLNGWSRGGAICVKGTAELTETTIMNFIGCHEGGALWVSGTGNCTLTSCHIINNRGNRGAGVNVEQGGILNASGTEITGNNANGGKAESSLVKRGGAGWIAGRATFTNCTITGNQSYYSGTRFFVDATGAVTCTGCTVDGSDYGDGEKTYN